MTDALKVTAKLYCNRLAMERGLNPAGSAGSFRDVVTIETSLPWKHEIYEQAGKLPQEAIDLLELWLKRYYEGEPYDHILLMVAPDPEYSRPGFRRVMYHSRPDAPFARFDKLEYLVPEAELGALLWALFEARADLPRFESYRIPYAEAIRDLLVCTHGTVDVACAKFGYPLYKYLRKQHACADLRVWRVSHFGGHVFAPTLVDLPLGHLWGYVEEAQADQIVAQTGSVEALYGHYRGWTGLHSGILQAAEGAVWQREGWRWFEYPKHGEVIAQSAETDQPQWADVQVEFRTPDAAGVYGVRVEMCDPIETEHTTGEGTYAYPQYRVTRLEKRS